jgi:hypothetical protein
LKGRMTKVIRFLYVNRSLESLLSKRPIYIQIRALALAFQLARAPRRAFWDVGAQLRNPGERGIYNTALALVFQLARAPPARCKGCRNEVTKSLLKNQWTKL